MTPEPDPRRIHKRLADIFESVPLEAVVNGLANGSKAAHVLIEGAVGHEIQKKLDDATIKKAQELGIENNEL